MLNKDLNFEIEEYQFQSFSKGNDNGEVTNFEFQDLQAKVPVRSKEHQEIIKIERNNSKVSGFDISPIVRQHRGIKKQEDLERDEAIENEVRKRVAKLEEDAFREGYEKGIAEGRDFIYQETRAQTEEKLIVFTDMINDVLSTKEEILKNQKMQLYSLVKTLTKWVTLKELKDDGQYIERLLEKLILEAGHRENLLIQVDQKHFELMPEVLETVQAKLGELVNVRVETDYDIQSTGLILESQNGIINGTLNEQLKSLDKIFESVGLASELGENENIQFSQSEPIKDASADNSDIDNSEEPSGSDE